MLDRLPNSGGVVLQQIAHSGYEEVGAAGIKALLNQQIDLAEVDGAYVERDFFRICHTCTVRKYSSRNTQG